MSNDFSTKLHLKLLTGHTVMLVSVAFNKIHMLNKVANSFSFLKHDFNPHETKNCTSFKIMYELLFLMMLKGTCMQTFSLSLSPRDCPQCKHEGFTWVLFKLAPPPAEGESLEARTTVLFTWRAAAIRKTNGRSSSEQEVYSPVRGLLNLQHLTDNEEERHRESSFTCRM